LLQSRTFKRRFLAPLSKFIEEGTQLMTLRQRERADPQSGSESVGTADR
jgi:hypothetical protein